MILLEMIEERLIKTDLEARDKEELFEELLDVLVKAKKVKNRQLALQALWEREKKGSTDIGKGVAIPHAKTRAVDELVVAVGISPTGIDYGSDQGEPAHIVFMMIATENNPGLHVEALADIASLVDSPSLRRQLRHAQTPKEVLAFIVAEAKARMSE